METKSLKLISLAIPFFLVILGACAPQPLTVTREPATIRIAADESCSPVIEDLATAYEEANPWITVEVQSFNNAIAEERLRNGTTDLAALTWMTPSSPPLWSTPFATDAIVIVAHPGINVDNLNQDQLQDIFRGRAGEWADGTPIQVVSREAGAGTRAAFESQVMDEFDVTLTAVVMPSNERVVDHVASTPGAIGYVSLSTPTNGVNVLSIGGVRPSPDTTSSYALTYLTQLAALVEPAGETDAFAKWVQSPDGQRWVRRVFGPLPTQ